MNSMQKPLLVLTLFKVGTCIFRLLQVEIFCKEFCELSLLVVYQMSLIMVRTMLNITEYD